MTLKIVKITLITEEIETKRDGNRVVLNRWQFDTGAGSSSLKTAFDEAAVKMNEAVTRLCAEIPEEVPAGPKVLDSEGKEN